MRFDKPIGIWLLFFPAGWAVGLAAIDFGEVIILSILMLLGATITRAAGCIINDLTDQNLDAEVERTRTRPLAAGLVSRKQALILLVGLGLAALLVALCLPDAVLVIALIAVPMIAAYPWMKRVTHWPQAFLGLTFNLGALMGWAATGTPLTFSAVCLYMAAVLWTLAYDTIYAVQDMEDDSRIGILSSARKVGINGLTTFVTCCYSAVLFLFLVVGILTHAGVMFYLGIGVCACHAIWQIKQLPCPPEKAGALFRSNQWFGLALFVGILLDRMVG